MNQKIKKVIIFILAFLARIIILKHKPYVIGVTGSFGKSSTKEAIFHILSSSQKKVRRNKGNLNNEFGLPLVVIGDFDHAGGVWLYFLAIIKGICVFFNDEYPDILVLEYGADKPGDIKYLTSIVRPDIAVVTGISEIPVHVEFYSSSYEVAEEKFNLIKFAKDNSTIILNADDKLVAHMAEKINSNTLFYGFAFESDFRIHQFNNCYIKEKPTGISFTLATIGKFLPVNFSGVLGRGHAYAITAAIACGSVLKIPITDMIESVSKLEILPGRSRIIEGIQDSWIIDDSYNSSPSALHEALNVLKSLPAKRKIAILGGMMELGRLSKDAHRELGIKAASSANIIIGIGELGKELIAPAKRQGKKTQWFNTSLEAVAEIKKMINKGDLILIKGSQSVRVERITKAIMKHPEKANSLLVRQYGNWVKK